MVQTGENTDVWKLLEQVADPEVPVLTILDLGVVRAVAVDGKHVEVTITPTYSGCPAMNVIEIDIKAILQENGYESTVKTVLSPAWTTDWLSEDGKRKLKEYGIAPPVESTSDKGALFSEEREVPCPQCDSLDTVQVSQFGSTACKSLYKCNTCLEPFDYFKCH